MIIACPRCTGLNRVPAEKSPLDGKCGKCGSPLFLGTPLALSSASAAAHWEKSEVPVLVDFWAAWCGPCRMMAPLLDQAAPRFEPFVRIAKVDTEAEPMLASRFNIRSIPTLVLIQKGQEIARVSGAMPLPSLVQWVESHVALS